jgi:predicted nucleic acid-binding protein
VILCDISVIIDIDRGRLEVEAILRKHEGELVGISAITIQEIFVGLGYQRAKSGTRQFEKTRARLQKILDDFKVVDITTPILEQAGLLEGELHARGIRVDAQDYIIAATAQQVQASKILTRNPDHFKHFPLLLEIYTIK